MSPKSRTRRTTTRNIRFPNQKIEQINIALDQNTTTAPVQTGLRKRLIYDTKSDH
ncbi:YlcI/YnfO family protein [Escherichia coli]|uniref:YlcI/YnfO family protein n=1 Tax=Escherichia coli TaxID=562 RepID=UPI000A73D516